MGGKRYERGFLDVRLPGPCGKLVDLWINDLETNGRQEWTVYQYKKEVGRLLSMYPEHGPADFTKMDIDVWKMERSKGRSASTTRRAVIAAKSFFTYCEDVDAIVKTPMRRVGMPPIPEHEPSFWTPDEVRKILAAPMPPRNRLLINTLARAGQRLTPTRTLQWHRIHETDKVPHIAFGKAKGGKFHQVPMDRTLYTMFRDYRRLVQPQEDAYVFESRSRPRNTQPGTLRGPLLSPAVYRIITEACRAAGVRVAGPHELRRSLATKLLADPTVPFVVVSKGILNHKNPQTTLQHYAGQDFDQVAAALKDTF